MKAKHLDKALDAQFAEEGAAKLFKPEIGGAWIVGVVGSHCNSTCCRAASRRSILCPSGSRPRSTKRPVGCLGDPKALVDAFVAKEKGQCAMDHDGDPVFMIRIPWDVDRVERDYEGITLSRTKEMLI